LPVLRRCRCLFYAVAIVFYAVAVACFTLLPLLVLRRCRCLFYAVILERSEGSPHLLLSLLVFCCHPAGIRFCIVKGTASAVPNNLPESKGL
jgi:hypothetical protein